MRSEPISDQEIGATGNGATIFNVLVIIGAAVLLLGVFFLGRLAEHLFRFLETVSL
jgi:hypothetical protein